ncbi:uncharacterized protein A4U43_C03F30090 [Asparagus officinalis]|uniref:Uncharacterized protein n=1 Tax=Asparagus officinalis TaxID=4686 RepID=A0A5P1FE15_ASPOF|nr:uncharacterized protein A4U43_C03F30090 [Asparagus officinalis]
MSSNDLHQALQVCLVQGASLEQALFCRLEHMLAKEKSAREEGLEQEVDALKSAGGSLGDSSLAAARRRLGHFPGLGRGH